jgi:thymidylate synthase (FAD)
MNVTLIESTPFPEQLCGAAASVCTNSDDHKRSLKHALASGHTSVMEHAVFTFMVDGLSRAALAQLTRHRVASFDVQSQRYVRLDNPELVIPESIKVSPFAAEAESTMRYVMNLYQRMVEAGIPCEDARYVTPQAVPTTLIMTMNARELLHFFSLRTCNRAQWEIRELADRMLCICKEKAPLLFEIAGPACVTGFCMEKRPCGHPRAEDDWNNNKI